MNEMYGRIEFLCKKKGINITQMCREADIPRGNLTDLKMGRTSELSTKSLGKIALYFGVSLDYLLGACGLLNREEQRDGAEQMAQPSALLAKFTYAMYNEWKDLTPENQEKLIEMARFFKEQQEKGKK